MKLIKQTYFLFLISTLSVLVFTSSCTKESDMPIEPVITDISFDLDLKHLIVEFSDGDGDFGITAGDPDFPQYLDPDSTIENPYYYNLWVDYFEKIDGQWELVELENTFNFTMPDITPQGQSKQLEVIVTYDMVDILPLPGAESDSIKFSVVLVDRAKHESLPRETGALYIP